jgi:hypothetical protein
VVNYSRDAFSYQYVPVASVVSVLAIVPRFVGSNSDEAMGI